MSRRVGRSDMLRNTARHPTARRARARPAVRVLVVDDHADTRSLYADYLAHHGIEVAEAADGIEAVSVGRRFAPDVVLMDLSMPRADGLVAIRGLRASREARAAIVYLITAFDSDPRLVRPAGVDRLIIKPCAPADLLAWIGCDMEKRALLAQESDAG